MKADILTHKNIETTAGQISVVNRHLRCHDHLGTIKARFNIGRMNYRVEPGLYAVGDPNPASPVFLSANYKMSFDSLRRELKGIDAWILVLDTKGINVWCAAGKGTFGTQELISKITDTVLAEIVSHRQIVCPQLGAPGIAAHEVKNQTGFKIIFGPVRAADIKAFIAAGYKATEEMRTVNFPLIDRLILTPMEIIPGLKYAFLASLIFFLASGLSRHGFSIELMLKMGPLYAAVIIMAFLSGALFTPLMLPFIPGRAFSLKGFMLSIPLFLIAILIPSISTLSTIEKAALFCIMAPISSYFAMLFTGASTYTSLSGVKKEMKFAVPIQATSLIIGIITWLILRFI